MEYQIGKPGRIMVARLKEGEHVYECIEEIARKEDIQAAVVFIVGGIRNAHVKVGPRQETGPIEPNFKEFRGPGEVVGVGTIFWDEEGPSLHLHSALGRGDLTVVGCPRGGAQTFLVLEVTIIEMEGITARRVLDEQSGFKLLQL
ncbi:MAG: DUF296 domain-containing protein [Sedimentisphaerales bacterium]|nr:DUF296 domain-containing protein [Sedimentisphaerales bacterium]